MPNPTHGTPLNPRPPAGVQNPIVSVQTSLPQTIPPPSLPFVLQDANGNSIIDATWYLFLYNLTRQVLPLGGNPPVITKTILQQVPPPPVLFQETDYDENAQIIVGPAGPRGIQGPVGYSIALDGADGDEGMPIPGQAGLPGSPGAQGPAGAILYMEGDAGDEGLIGPPGPQGVAGVGGSGNQGSATIDFGTGALDAKVAVTGQAGIVSGSLIRAWLSGLATSNNLADAGFAEDIAVFAGDIVAGTGFTVYAFCRFGSAFGQYVTNWSWA